MIKCARVSSSIENFREKINKRYGLKPYYFFTDFNKSVIFFGLYHWVDYVFLVLHPGPKTIFFCGGDITNLSKRCKFIQWVVKKTKVRHICENDSERETLKSLGIKAEILPQLFADDPGIHFKPGPIHVYMNCHPDREKEYGLFSFLTMASFIKDVKFHVYGIKYHRIFPNVVFHGQVSEEQFNKEIRNYHAAIRFNKIDGFSEVIAKSLLLGQYPISAIKYKGVDSFETLSELMVLLAKLKDKKTPNPASYFWRREFDHNKNVLLHPEQNQI